MLLEGAEGLVDRPDAAQDQGVWIGGDPEPQPFELCRGEEGGFPSLYHVGHRGDAERTGGDLELFHRGRRFEKDDVGSRPLVELPALDRLLQSRNRDGIGARDYQKFFAAPGVNGRFDLQRHLSRLDQALAGGVAAFFRHFLVLDLDGLGPGLLVLLDRPAHVEGIPVFR